MSEIINIGTIANDGTGDTLRGAGEKINANFALPHFGIYDYADLATQTTPIVLNAGNSYLTSLTNDGLGTGTNLTYKLPDVDFLWSSIFNWFIFSELNLGDEVLIRVDLEVTTTVVNQLIDIYIDFAGGDYRIHLCPQIQYKTASSHKVITTTSVYMGNTDTLNIGSKIYIKSDNDATVKVNGFYIKASKRIV